MSDENLAHEAVSDRRSAERAIALFRPAIVEIDDLQTFCLVRNISATGLMASVHSKLSPADKVSFHFSESAHVTGQVVWSEVDRIGVKFEVPIAVSEFLTKLASQTPNNSNYRSPRLQVSCTGEFIVHPDIRDFDVLDISQRGLKARISNTKVGEEGVVALPGLEPRRAVVRWARDEQVGMYFIEPIGFSELGQWVIAQSASQKFHQLR